MSHAVFDLALEMPPIAVTRVRIPDTSLWWATSCSVCGKRTRPRPLLSAAMRDMYRHGAEHVAYMLNRATEQPAHRVQALDVVHLTEREAS